MEEHDLKVLNNAEQSESFRDSLGIVNKEGARKWVYPKEPKGRYTTARNFMSGFLLFILFCTPFMKIDGHPVMLFNIIERKFILFGMVFGPHDFYLLGLATITTVVFIFLFTVAFGRLFCGWICPQTVFMESVFRKIDYWIEGNEKEQRRLNESVWTGEKVRKKFAKYVIYFFFSFLISNMLLAWIIGVDDLHHIITDSVAEHVTGFVAIVIFTLIFYGIFIWFREQACILVCPYGRLQGVLLDQNSIIIAYDYLRGEPRGKIRKKETRTNGDCVECNQCVEVCPTGIDIRNGTQLECVNCTACIDACDYVMEKINKPRGLIRYDSANGIKNKTGFIITPRVIGYSIVLTVLLVLVTYLFVTRKDVDVTVLRTPGMFFQEQPDGRVSNIYDIKALNKTFHAMPLSMKLENIGGEIKIIGVDLNPQPQEVAATKFFVLLTREKIASMNTPIVIGVYAGDKLINTITTSFLGPVQRKK